MNTQPNTESSNPNAPDPLAVALSKLDPAPHGFEWNALMFAAGRASKTRALTFWRVVAGVCAGVACGFALAFLARPEVVVERERVVYVERTPEKAAEPLPAVPEPHPARSAITGINRAGISAFRTTEPLTRRSSRHQSRGSRCAGSIRETKS